MTSIAEAETAGAAVALEAKIPLGTVNGRIDHLAIDLKRQRLFVAELGSDGVGVVDLAGRTQSTMMGLKEPQGIAYDLDRLFVAVRAAGREAAAIWVFRPTP